MLLYKVIYVIIFSRDIVPSHIFLLYFICFVPNTKCKSWPSYGLKKFIMNTKMKTKYQFQLSFNVLWSSNIPRYFLDFAWTCLWKLMMNNKIQTKYINFSIIFLICFWVLGKYYIKWSVITSYSYYEKDLWILKIK